MEKRKLVSVLVTAGILGILLMAGPAFAYLVSLNIADDSVEEGQDVEFTANVQIGSDEFVDIQNLTLEVFGPVNRSCVFDVNGNELSGCEDVDVELVSAPNFTFGYGYGYGFNDGNLTYNITVKGDGLEAGNYSSEIILNVAGDESSYAGPDFEVLARNEKVVVCHVPPGNPGNAQTISIGESAVAAHLAHGDYLGECVEGENSSNGNGGNGGNNGQGNNNGNAGTNGNSESINSNVSGNGNSGGNGNGKKK